MNIYCMSGIFGVRSRWGSIIKLEFVGFTTSCNYSSCCKKKTKNQGSKIPSLWAEETKVNLYQNDGKEKEHLIIQSVADQLSHLLEAFNVTRVCRRANGTCCLVFMDEPLTEVTR